MRVHRFLLSMLVALAGGCGGEPSTGPWLTYPGVEGHFRYFPLAGTAHDVREPSTGVTCGNCHPGTTFTQFDCTTCHTAATTGPRHASVPAYVHASPSCFECHPDGASGAAPPDHDTRLFPRGSGTAHGAVACRACHTDLARPNVPSSFACGTCHLSLDATLVSKHTNPANRSLRVAASEISTADSATCLRCHADAQVVTTHRTTQEGDPPHEGARCLQCHDVPRADKPFGIDFASDPALASKLASRRGCYHCHESAPPDDD
ncbi:MAG TPA: hypothetical protein VEB43_07790 [Anaeromyxobacter sp.]|nr:hypothetical protein [Anaeromyxobacter sp.]